jgi:hypothetical protein
MESLIEFIDAGLINNNDHTYPVCLYNHASLYKQEKNYDGYFALITMSANLNYDKAITELTNSYYKKLHLKQDHTKMLQFYEHTETWPHSANYLGYMYKKGLGVEKDFEKAIWCYKSADIENNTNAMIGLGIIFAYEECQFNDYQRGGDLLYNAYKRGNINANFFCANSFQYGGLQKYPDFTKTDMFNIYDDEIKVGNTNAMCEMAKLLNGHVDNNALYHKTAKGLCKLAGDNGDGYGYALYALYIQDKNFDKAYLFYIKGVELGDHSARRWLCDLVVEHPTYENKLLAYCVDNKNDKLLQIYKNKADLTNEFVTLYMQMRDLCNKNQQLIEDNQKLASENKKFAYKNKKLSNQNIQLIKENIILKDKNVTSLD